MALQVLWARCQVVVCGRRGREKVYDVPERALSTAAERCALPFDEWGVLERVEAAGLLPDAAGPWWSVLRAARKTVVPRLLADGRLIRVRVEGATRSYLASPDLFERRWPGDDGRMRILGPLDPLIWDRKLVHQVFGFEYIWEVYKPAKTRRWGWYVCPLLHRGALVGRFEGRVVDGRIELLGLWREGPGFDEDAWRAALAEHEANL